MVFDKVRDREWFELPGHRRTEDLRGARRAARKKSSRRTEEPPHEKAHRRGRTRCPGVHAMDVQRPVSAPHGGVPGRGSDATCRSRIRSLILANMMNPSPRRVSLELLTRKTFQPATILNVIAAAWIQFMVHDWFVHKKGTWDLTHDIPLRRRRRLARTTDARAQDSR